MAPEMRPAGHDIRRWAAMPWLVKTEAMIWTYWRQCQVVTTVPREATLSGVMATIMI